MKFLESWWHNKFKKRSYERITAIGAATFATPQGQELLQCWVDGILLKPPAGSDANETLAWKSKCEFVVDIIVALDAHQNPDKYRVEAPKARNVVGGNFGG